MLGKKTFVLTAPKVTPVPPLPAPMLALLPSPASAPVSTSAAKEGASKAKSLGASIVTTGALPLSRPPSASAKAVARPQRRMSERAVEEKKGEADVAPAREAEASSPRASPAPPGGRA